MRLESFIGKATLAVDAAGRTNFPKEFRKVLSEDNEGQVVVTIGGANTLALYPLSEWNRYVQYLDGLGRGPDVTKFRTRVTAMAKLSALDAQNRIVLTAEQLAYAGIRGEVTFVGAGNCVRLWAPARYNDEIAATTPDEEARFSNWY
jgi:MraZ protein